MGCGGTVLVSNAEAQPTMVPGTSNHYYIPATDKTVHWGYFSKLLKPLVEVNSGDFVTIEALTHHANDDARDLAIMKSALKLGVGDFMILARLTRGLK